MRIVRIWLLTLVAIELALAGVVAAQITDPPNAQPGNIVGTAINVNNATVSGAAVVLQGPAPTDRRTVATDDRGFFEFRDIKPGIPYHVTISAQGYAAWTSPAIILKAGQYKILTGTKLRVAEVRTAITVTPQSSEQVATQQVKEAEKQRVFGVIPNFYVVYNPHPEPLTTKLKFKLAFKVATDPVTIFGILMFAGIDQAANTPDYVQGAKGYGQRVGATAADGFSDLLIGGAVLPSLLHQDPRYFYKGTGTKKSRALYALSHPFVCKGDNGRLQPNYSSMGGDLAASALTNLYYPDSNRGVGLVFKNFAIDTGERAFASLVQEFVLRKLTKVKKKKNSSGRATTNQP